MLFLVLFVFGKRVKAPLRSVCFVLLVLCVLISLADENWKLEKQLSV